jgi:hypothetical protein
VEELRRITENVRKAGVPAEILTKHLTNISLEEYRYENLLTADTSFTTNKTSAAHLL